MEYTGSDLKKQKKKSHPVVEKKNKIFFILVTIFKNFTGTRSCKKKEKEVSIRLVRVVFVVFCLRKMFQSVFVEPDNHSFLRKETYSDALEKKDEKDLRNR